MRIVFKKIQNKEIFEDIKKIHVFLDNIIINFDLEPEKINKKVIFNSEEKFYQFFIESKNLSLYFTYWMSIDYLFVEIYGDIEISWKIYNYLKEYFKPKYISISEQQIQKQDQDVQKPQD